MQDPQSRDMSNIEISFRRIVLRHSDMHALMEELLRLYARATERERQALFGLVVRQFSADIHARAQMRRLPGGRP